MKMKTQKSVILKRNMKNRRNILKSVSNRGIKSTIKRKILPNRFGKRQNIPKRVSNRQNIPKRVSIRQNIPKRVSDRGIKSLENNFSVKATKKIINTSKIVMKNHK